MLICGLLFVDFFKCVYNGFAENAIIWFVYMDENNSFENPVKFQLNDWQTDEYSVYPSIVGSQLGFGQVPIHLNFADRVHTRCSIDSAIAYGHLKNLEPDTNILDLGIWQAIPFTTIPFKQWWSEWQEHIFCISASNYCKNFDINYEEAENEVLYS